MRKGKGFEDLVAWIQECLHERAEVDPNARLPDVDTGRSRQVDVAVAVHDGPTRLLAIIEVRETKRPIGVKYVEEISAKKRSVGADAAFLVSRSGFASTAIHKARELGIRTLTYDQATNEDWSGWMQCRSITVFEHRWDKLKVKFTEHETGHPFNPSPQVLRLLESDDNAEVLLNEQGAPLIGFRSFVEQVVRSFGDLPYKDLEADGTWHTRKLLLNRPFVPPMWIEANDGQRHRVGHVYIQADFALDSHEHPWRLSRYRYAQSANSEADIASAEIELGGHKRTLRVLVPGGGDHIRAGATLHIWLSPSRGHGKAATGERTRLGEAPSENEGAKND